MKSTRASFYISMYIFLVLTIKTNAAVNFDDGNHHIIDYSISDWTDVDYYNPQIIL